VSHCDDDELAVIALGEPARPADEAHLSTCSRCQSRLDQLAGVVGTARSIRPEDHPVTPPDSVWAGITDELASDQTGSVTSLDAERERRRPRLWLVAASAAAVGLLVGGGLVAAVNGSRTTSDVIASATLNPLEGSTAHGTAKVEKVSAGDTLTVSVTDLPAPADGYYEVWMATADTTTMVAIGTLPAGSQATFALPPGMDPTQFPVVDVSLEHFDGDAAHSATSVARGQLTA